MNDSTPISNQKTGGWGCCKACSKPIWIRPSQVGRKHFCSRACQWSLRKKGSSVCECGKPKGGYAPRCRDCANALKVQGRWTHVQTARKQIHPGQAYGRLTVLSESFQHQTDRALTPEWHVLCRCQCGAERPFRVSGLFNGTSKSCGCLNREIVSVLHRKHGHSGYVRSRLYKCWEQIKQRCHNPNCVSYPNYGGRGIDFCPEWAADFLRFRDWALSHGYREDLSIDRIDVNGPYAPENCRWATNSEQARNRRDTAYVTAFGETKPRADWISDPRCCVGDCTLRQRLERGWSAEAAMTTATVWSKVMLTAFDETKRLPDWAKDPRCQVGEAALRRRISTGWDHQEAIMTPVNCWPPPN